MAIAAWMSAVVLVTVVTGSSADLTTVLPLSSSSRPSLRHTLIPDVSTAIDTSHDDTGIPKDSHYSLRVYSTPPPPESSAGPFTGGDVTSSAVESSVTTSAANGTNGSSSADDGSAVQLGDIRIGFCPLWSCRDRCFRHGEVRLEPEDGGQEKATSASTTAPAGGSQADNVKDFESSSETSVDESSKPDDSSRPVANVTGGGAVGGASRCACDWSCVQLGDCCVDFFSLCLNVTGQARVVALVTQALRDDMDPQDGSGQNSTLLVREFGSCVRTAPTQRFTMVTRCPDLDPNHDPATREKCHDADRLPHLSPYSHPLTAMLTFRNIYCARCHGYQAGQLVPWDQGISCKDTAASDTPSNGTASAPSASEETTSPENIFEKTTYSSEASHKESTQLPASLKDSSEGMISSTNETTKGITSFPRGSEDPFAETGLLNSLADRGPFPNVSASAADDPPPFPSPPVAESPQDAGASQGAETPAPVDLTRLVAWIRSGDCSYFYRPPGDLPTQPRPCLDTSLELDVLNGTHEAGASNNGSAVPGTELCTYEDLLLCRTYSYQTFTEGRGEVRNPHCAKCITGAAPVEVELPCARDSSTGGEEEEEIKGLGGGILALFSTDDTSGAGYLVVEGRRVDWPGFLCGDDEVFDHIFLVCRRLYCPAGQRPTAGRCQPLAEMEEVAVAGDSQLLPAGTQRIFATFLPTDRERCRAQQSALGESVRSLPARQEVWTNVSTVLSATEFTCLENSDADLNDADLNDAQFNDADLSDVGVSDVEHPESYSMRVTVHVASDLPLALGVLDTLLHDCCPRAVGEGAVTVTNYDRHVQVACQQGNVRIVDNATVKESDGQLFMVTSEGAMTSLYPLTNVAFKIHFVEEFNTPGQGVEDQGQDQVQEQGQGDGEGQTVSLTQLGRWVFTVVLCETARVESGLNCSSVVFALNRTRLENGTLRILDSGLVYPESQFELHEHFALVCAGSFSNLNERWSVSFFQFSAAQYWVSWACSLTSVLCLVTSLGAFCCFPHLRTLAGRMTASLAGSLAAGQVLLLVDFVKQKVICSVIAAVCHFCWLAAFSWMTALAVHMARTFLGNMATSAGKHDGKHAQHEYRKYGVWCWGVSMATVLALFILDNLESANPPVGYGGRQCGWMQQSLVFLVPAALALAVNVVCFLLTLVSIERTMRASRAALSRQQSGDRRRVVVYSKMAGVMGFTWIAGFLAAFSGEPALWWAYILLNGLQGAFVAFAFVLNARLLRFLKARLRQSGKKPRARGPLSCVTKASDDASALRHQRDVISVDEQKVTPRLKNVSASATSITIETTF